MLEFYCISYVVIFSVYILSDLGFWSNLIGSFIVSLLFAISEYHVLDNDENTTLVVIGRCFFVFVQLARGFENVWDYFGLKKVKSSKKVKQELFTRKKNRDEVWDRETMFSQLAKRSPSVVVSG